MRRCPLASGKPRYRAKPSGERQATGRGPVRGCPALALARSRKRGWRHLGASLPRRLGLAFLFVGLALAPTDRRAEDVAEAVSRIGRTELGHRPLLFIALAR